jgi:hypothetical protein
MSQQDHDQELKALEDSLRELAPSSGTLTTELLMFRAGRSSIKNRHWLWPASTAVLAVISCGLAAAWQLWPKTATMERIVYVEKEAGIPTKDSTAPADIHGKPDVDAHREIPGHRLVEPPGYLHDRDLALRLGVDALRSPSGESRTASGNLDDLDKILKPAQAELSFDLFRAFRTNTGDKR